MHDDAHETHELSFIKKYVFSVDHKVIGIQYAVTALTFLFCGFTLMMLMRWQLAYPNTPLGYSGDPTAIDWDALPFLARVASWVWGESNMPSGVMNADFYNQLGAMHGTIMIFLGVVPLAVGGFGNYVLPLQIGAPDMAFPRLNMASYWSFLPGGLLMLSSFFLPGGAAQSGWTSYPPLSVFNPGQTVWLIAMVFLITSSLLGSVNFIVTVIQLRVKGMTLFRMPYFVWAQFITSFLLLLAFPPLEAAAVLQLMDRVGGTSFFLPAGLVVNNTPLDVVGGGNPILWQHLFWFLAHPEVYVLILPAIGIVTEVIANNTRKPIGGYRIMVNSALFLAFMSFIVWAHHMFLTGMGTTMSSFFQFTTMVISIPSIVIITNLIINLWGGRIRFNSASLFALAFIPMFGIGGLTGLPLGLTVSDIYLHDTYYVIGHFHYVVAPGTVFALFAGIYYWFPKATGRRMSEVLGKIHFVGSFIFINLALFPMFIQGLHGVNRRLFDQTLYTHGADLQQLTEIQSWGVWLLACFQAPFIFNFFWSAWKGAKVGRNPWAATTLEWAAPSPPGHGNFEVPPVVHRGPYDYTLQPSGETAGGDPEPGVEPGAKVGEPADFALQCTPLARSPKEAA